MVSNKKQGILMIVLIVLLVVAVGYIGFGKYGSWSDAKEVGMMQYGASQAIEYIAQQAGPGSCQQVPLMIGDQTINVISIECLQQAPAARPAPAAETAEETPTEEVTE